MESAIVDNRAALLKGQKWLKRYLKSNPLPVRWESSPGSGYYVGIDCSIDLYAVANLAAVNRGSVVLYLEVHRAGPDARSTEDGPIENDHFPYTKRFEWVNFDDAAFSRMMEYVRRYRDTVIEKFNSEVAGYKK